MIRVGQVFMWPNGATALVTEGPREPRRKWLACAPEARGKHDLGMHVHTLAVWDDSGVHWPVERLERTLARWDLEGRRIA